MSRVAVLIRAGRVQCVNVCTRISMNIFVHACLEGLSVVDVGVRAMTGHSSARCGLRRL